MVATTHDLDADVRRRLRRRPALVLADTQEGVLSLRQAYLSGLTRWEVMADLRAERWRRAGRQCVVVHTGPLGPRAREWLAVLDAGPRACLDGASALVASGLQDFAAERIRVSVPRGAKVVRSRDVDVRQTRRWRKEDIVPGGVRRTRPAVAAVRAGLWARTDREAELVLSMAVQQRLVTPAQLASALLAVRRDRRRLLLNELVLEIAGGGESLGELDVARECRRRGLPEPTGQAVRRAPGGRYYLDLSWETYGVVVEVDGLHHAWVQNVVGDALRQNQLALGGDLVLRLPLLGLRWAPDEFFHQVEQALRSRGWRQQALGA